jgi:hypothetical protein
MSLKVNLAVKLAKSSSALGKPVLRSRMCTWYMQVLSPAFTTLGECFSWHNQHNPHVSYVKCHRDEVEPLVKNIRGNNHKGYQSRREAERSYVLAGALGSLCVLSRNPTAPCARAAPMPEQVMAAFASTSNDFLEAEWYVVFKGLRPRVYPAW